MEDLVLYEVIDRVGYITLNRPEKRNALSYDFVLAIKLKLREAEEDETCKVIVIKSNGEAFCSGADLASLQQLQNNTFEENLADSKHLAALYLQIYQSPKIIISRVEVLLLQEVAVWLQFVIFALLILMQSLPILR